MTSAIFKADLLRETKLIGLVYAATVVLGIGSAFVSTYTSLRIVTVAPKLAAVDAQKTVAAPPRRLESAAPPAKPDPVILKFGFPAPLELDPFVEPVAEAIAQSKQPENKLRPFAAEQKKFEAALAESKKELEAAVAESTRAEVLLKEMEAIVAERRNMEAIVAEQKKIEAPVTDRLQRKKKPVGAGPFAGLAGAWTGNGTVSLADGTTERIRCKAEYKVNNTGLGLKQNLLCASNNYKFDLSSDVTSKGDRIFGNWSEKSRNIFGNLQGTAGAGHIDVFVETGNGEDVILTLTTNGNKQKVAIRTSHGQHTGVAELTGVNITLSR